MNTTRLQRAQAVADAGERLAAAHGVVLPGDLRLWALADGRRPVRPSSTGTDTAGTGRDRHRDPARDRLSPPTDVDLAAALEAATSSRQRRARGLHVTPRWLADQLVGLVVDERPGPRPSACDPSCGGGAFLLAVARALHARGMPRRQVVEEALWGADIDPVGLAAAEAALAIWSGGAVPPLGRLVVGDPLRQGAELWVDRPPGGFDLVVGNPPFQSQLGKATARARAYQLRLRARFGPAVRAYTDTAWLFLLFGCQVARPGGRVVMVQPDSLAAARDAAAVRAEIDQLAHLDQLWVDDHRVFAAAVRVCAPVLRRYEAPGGTGSGTGSAAGTVADADARAGTDEAPGSGAGRGPGERGGVGSLALAPAPGGGGGAVRAGGDGAGGGRWNELLAEATGIPPLDLASRGRLSDLAVSLAGFRDEYYGLTGLVREAGPAERDRLTPGGPGPGSGPPGGADGAGSREARDGDGRDGEAAPARVAALVTVGALDWGRSSWGRRPVRFAKRRWEAPVVDPALLDERGTAAARRWVARTAVPKVVVATQTRVVEPAVDEHGDWVPSVPAVVVVPRCPEDLWLVAAALASPAATVWLFRRAPGVALARGALKVAARDVADLPLPAGLDAWRAAATALADHSRAPAGGPAARAALDAFTEAAAVAYASPPAVVRWWRDRLDAVLAD